MNPITIAIDGFSSSGKSTMAKALATKIGYRYIDSGAMYRAVTLYALKNGMINSNGSVKTDLLIAALPEIKIDFIPTESGQHTILNGKDVENEIRTMEVSSAVSPVAAIPEVRHQMVSIQKHFGKEKGIVMDGRDIGTAVFPDAEMKIFVTASPETRAMRRYKELVQKGGNPTFDEVLANITSRDHLDQTRDESPLRKADDAFVLDNSDLSMEEQLNIIYNIFEDRTR